MQHNLQNPSSNSKNKRGEAEVNLCEKEKKKICRFLSYRGSASLPQQKKTIPLPAPLFSKGTNKSVSFRPSAWLRPQLQSASVTCIIVRSQTHSPPVAMTKRCIITLKSPKKPSGLLQNNPASINFLSYEYWWMNEYYRKRKTTEVWNVHKETFIV